MTCCMVSPGHPVTGPIVAVWAQELENFGAQLLLPSKLCDLGKSLNFLSLFPHLSKRSAIK